MGPHFTAARFVLRRPVLLVPAAVPVPSGWVPEVIDAFLDRSRVGFAAPTPTVRLAYEDDEPTVLFSLVPGPAVDVPEPQHFRRTSAA